VRAAGPAQQEQKQKGTSNSGSAAGASTSSMGSSNAARAGSQGGMASEEHDPELVRSVQQALKQKGYDVGTIDGQFGPSTESALRQFQQAQGLSQSGSLDAQTLSALGVEQGQASQGGTSSGQGSQHSGQSAPQSGQSSPSASTSIHGSTYK
jgi:His-Xaa-Ser repeat protein HxsA